MISAFGIEHSISKSFVPGSGYSIKTGVKGYKRAVDLTDTERHIVRNKALGESARMKRTGGRMQMAERRNKAGKSRTQIYPGVATPKGKGKLVELSAHRGAHGANAHTPDGGVVQGFSRPNGRGGGQLVVFGDAHDPGHTWRHETAHLTPKRNPVRFQDRTKNPTRLGREEGRADFVAAKKPTTGQYPGGAEFQSGYNEVQGKMASAQFKRKLRKQ